MVLIWKSPWTTRPLKISAECRQTPKVADPDAPAPGGMGTRHIFIRLENARCLRDLVYYCKWGHSKRFTKWLKKLEDNRVFDGKGSQLKLSRSKQGQTLTETLKFKNLKPKTIGDKDVLVHYRVTISDSQTNRIIYDDKLAYRFAKHEADMISGKIRRMAEECCRI